MKELIVLTGAANVGKSETLNRVLDLLREMFPSMKEVAMLRKTRKELRVVVEIDGIRVGIDSRGDREEHVVEALSVLHHERCSIIVCASHIRGQTIDEARRFAAAHRYNIFEISKTAAGTEAMHAKSNGSYANQIVSRIAGHLAPGPAPV